MAKFDAHQYLMRHGWICVQRTKRGMIWIIRWSKPGTDWRGVNQGTAVQVERDSQKWKQQQLAKGGR